VTWFKVDDKLHAHPKWTRCSAEAKALWVTAGAWSSSYKTDGVVPEHDLIMMARTVGLTPTKIRRAAANLVDNGMWKPLGDQPGWMFHNWTDFNPSRAQQELSAAVERERKKISRDDDLRAAIRLRDQDRCRYCDEPVSFAARTGHLAGRYDHVIPVSQGGKTTIENVVVACNYHNSLKLDKTPAEAGLTLLDPPFDPHRAQPRLSTGLAPAQPVQARSSGRGGSGRARTGRARGRAAAGRQPPPHSDADAPPEVPA